MAGSKKPRARSSRLKQKTLFESLSSSPVRSSHNSESSSPIQKGRGKHQQTQVDSDDDSDDGITFLRPSRRHTREDKGKAAESRTKGLTTPRRRAKSPTTTDDSDSDVNAIRFEPEVLSISEEEDAIRSPRKKRKLITSDEDEDAPQSPLQPLRNQFDGQRSQHQINDSEFEEEPQPRKRKLVKGRPSPRDSDLEDLANEVDEEHILDTRLRTRTKQSIFQRNLEKLKRRKQKKKESDESQENTESSDNHPFNLISGAKPSTSRIDSDATASGDDSQDDAFIVEDDGAAIAELPMEFSMETHQDLAHQFKKIFQFFVHIAVQPPNTRHSFMAEQMRTQQYFSVPLQIVRRKLSGLRDSLVTSSVWRPDFKKSLSTYPELTLEEMDFGIPSCDACHLGGRYSTLIGRLGGSQYDASGFQDVEDSSDSDDEEDPLQQVFHLGRFCARRTRAFHRFTHWEYTLFKTICREVDELHIRSRATKKQKKGFVRVANEGGIKPPEDLTDADGICDYFDQRRIIDLEWQQIKDMMESARHLEIAAKRGDAEDG